jgi:broad specificity phosphatase PhoE
MTRIVPIHAGPTPWDLEDRVVGNHPLPLTSDAYNSIDAIASRIPFPVTAVYYFKKNEACAQAAKIVGAKHLCPLHDSKMLDEWNLGLWQGLTRNELKFRYPTVVPQWQQNPLAVNPPDGESLGEAIVRIHGGIKRILRKNRGGAIVLPLRPLSMQIMLGILRKEDPPAIANHLQTISALETIEIADENLRELI